MQFADRDILKENDVKCLLAKNHHFIAIWGLYISTVMLQRPHTNPACKLFCLSSKCLELRKY